MANRNCILGVRLTKDEYYELTKKARKAGLSAPAFVRLAAFGQTVREYPGADVPVLIQEVRRVGKILDQIRAAAPADGVELRKALDENRAVEQMIVRAFGD